MGISYKKNLPNTFPEELLNLAKSLEHLGISEVAWDWQNAIRTVDFLCGCNYMILGGDVYKSSNGKLKSTYDSWYLNKDVTRSREQLLQESKDKAISYINKYHDMYGEDFYYSLVFNKIL